MAHQDCSLLETLVLPEAVCMAAAISCAEVFPRESMGLLVSRGRVLAKGSVKAALAIAIPFQSARRGERWCWSRSSTRLEKALGAGRWRRLGDFHSHTHRRSEPMCADPSENDLQDMKLGDLELIVAAIPTKLGSASWSVRGKAVVGRAAGYRFLMRAWVREKGRRPDGELGHRQVALELEKA